MRVFVFRCLLGKSSASQWLMMSCEMCKSRSALSTARLLITCLIGNSQRFVLFITIYAPLQKKKPASTHVFEPSMSQTATVISKASGGLIRSFLDERRRSSRLHTGCDLMETNWRRRPRAVKCKLGAFRRVDGGGETKTKTKRSQREWMAMTSCFSQNVFVVCIQTIQSLPENTSEHCRSDWLSKPPWNTSNGICCQLKASWAKQSSF